MKESEASAGTKLRAVVIAAQLGVTFKTALGYATDQAPSDWDNLCLDLQRGLVESVHARRKGTEPRDLDGSQQE